MLKTPASRLSPPDLALLHKGALDRCDASDGVTDRVIENPRACTFDPRLLQCAAGTTTNCLSADQVAAARAIYRGPTNARTGVPIMPGFEPGSELGWSTLVDGNEPHKLGTTGLKYMTFQDPNWDFRSFDWDKDVERVRTSQPYDASNPDIRAFVARGAKLLIYHGWTEVLNPPRNSIDYVAAVEKTLGVEKTRNAVRLFMAPGMNHCTGGEGPSVIDVIGELARNGTWHTPTLVSYYGLAHQDEASVTASPLARYVPSSVRARWARGGPQRVVAGRVIDRTEQRLSVARFIDTTAPLIAPMKAAGVRFLAGSDATANYAIPGVSLHEELALLVRHGLTPMEALQAATRNAAEFLGRLPTMGTLEPGKWADIGILDANPLNDISATRMIRGVVASGRYFDRPALDTLLNEAQVAAGR